MQTSNVLKTAVRAITAALALGATLGTAHAQATTATAYRQADLQVGLYYSGALPDYSPQKFYGLGGYVTYDFKPHWGVEFNVHQLSTTGDNHIYERTYEIGGRYVRRYGRFDPYARASIGRGVFNFPYIYDISTGKYDIPNANLAYNMFSGGGGVDIHIIPSINVRGDYEFQSWSNFPPHGLKPQVVSVGVAYHFH